MRLPAGIAVLALALGPLAGCSEDPYAEYCERVEENQADLTRVLGDAGDEGLLAALPIFTELSEAAPRDLVDEWDRVVGSLTRLRDTLEAEGVEPGEYDAANPPEGLDAAAIGRIEAAAERVAAPETIEALGGIEQHARDVCQTPLSL